jgi:hypothetical protein
VISRPPLNPPSVKKRTFLNNNKLLRVSQVVGKEKTLKRVRRAKD